MNQSPPASIWKMKPWWCQPWSIVLTGLLMPSGLWLLSHRLWMVLPVAAAVVLWWFVFLYAVPKQYAAALTDESYDLNSGDSKPF